MPTTAEVPKHVREVQCEFAGKPFRETAVFEKSHLILLLAHMIITNDGRLQTAAP